MHTIVCMRRLFFLLLAFLLGIPAFCAESHPNEPISIVTWNIQVGADTPLFGNGWTRRKLAFVQALHKVEPDILCVQEALLGQLTYIDQNFPGYKRVGVGRDNGKQDGEYCAIYYHSDKFQVIDSGTFWLSQTPDQPSFTWDGPYKRICTWARFHDYGDKTDFCVYNSHLPLKPDAQLSSAKLILHKIAENCPETNLIVAGVFNCGPNSGTWKEFQDSGLVPGGNRSEKTYHFGGHPLLCIDTIFVSKKVSVTEHRILKQPINGRWPSDHFGVYAKVLIEPSALSKSTD